MTMEQRLFALRDEAYADFNSTLVPQVERDRMIGVRVPALRRLAKELKGGDEARAFMASLPHGYFEENELHALLINEKDDFDGCIRALDAFLPYVDNWATNDILNPRCFKSNGEALITEVERWISAKEPYTVRFGLCTLMRRYLDGDFKEEYISLAAGVKSEEYYVKMMVAWFFATALAKRYEETLPYIKRRVLDVWTHNKAIQKAVESRRISERRKEYLKTLKRKDGAVEVAAALIWRDGKFLICRRPPHKARGLLWEFAGGKAENGETLEEALVRECREELGVTVRPDGVFTSLFYKYPDVTVHLTLFNAQIVSGELQKLEHADLRFISAEEADRYDFCPADDDILKKLRSIR